MSLLKEKATAFLMARIGRTAHVREVQALSASLVEVTLHLPEGLNWRSCQHLKCEAGTLNYRDYTVADWDAEIFTATLLIDAGHIGAGSNWVRQLHPGQTFLYSAGGGFHQPTAASALVGLGDASAIGHFLSLYKLKKPGQQFYTVIYSQEPLPDTIHGMPLLQADAESWLRLQSLPQGDTTFYVAGNIPMVMQTRRILKQQGWKQIKAAGFWE